MELLSQELRDATIVSIGHHAKLADFHHRKIILLRSRGGARLISEVHPVRSGSVPSSSAAAGIHHQHDRLRSARRVV